MKMKVTHEGISDNVFEILKADCIKAREVSYSPYSKFRVGCAILVSNDDDNNDNDNPLTITGANVENASYGAAICAERTAITKAVSMGYRKSFLAIAISTDLTTCASPCGICRQVIREFAGQSSLGLKLPIFMFNNDASDCIKMTIDELLPLSFGPDDLGIDPN